MKEYIITRCSGRGRVTVRSREAMEKVVMPQLSSGKKRKLYSQLENQYIDDVKSLNNSEAISQEESGISESHCTKHDDGVNERKHVNDLDSEGFENEISKSVKAVFSRETTPTRDFCGDSEEFSTDSSSAPVKKLTTKVTVHQRNVPAKGKIPSAAELEEFFSAAEKYEQQRFAEKYNYDVALDCPLEGRYKWEVNLQP